MIMGLDPKILLGIGLFLMVLGVALAYLQIISVLPLSFFLDFLSYGVSFVGLIAGMLGVISLLLRSRKRDR